MTSWRVREAYTTTSRNHLGARAPVVSRPALFFFSLDLISSSPFPSHFPPFSAFPFPPTPPYKSSRGRGGLVMAVLGGTAGSRLFLPFLLFLSSNACGGGENRGRRPRRRFAVRTVARGVGCRGGYRERQCAESYSK